MIVDERNTKRIRDDAAIAHDALESLMYAPVLSGDYINEKLNVVRACVEFISNFEEGKAC